MAKPNKRLKRTRPSALLILGGACAPLSRSVRLSAQIGLITKMASTALVYKCYPKQFRQEKEELRWT